MTYSAFDSLVKLQNDFPEVIVEIREDEIRKIINDVKSGKCDIGLITAKKIELREELVLVFSELATYRGEYLKALLKTDLFHSCK
ncbi:hypothetical protein COE25_07845 [Bacillus sp. AFS031507]|nr:hypothetical protein COE25_07845 [Bacillus sp. AFS031507]